MGQKYLDEIISVIHILHNMKKLYSKITNYINIPKLIVI